MVSVYASFFSHVASSLLFVCWRYCKEIENYVSDAFVCVLPENSSQHITVVTSSIGAM